MIDNYDSFTYNLVDLLRSLKVTELEVVFNDQIDWSQLELFQKILISPGPGTPQEAGQLTELIHKYYSSKSILGICLGHQAMALEFGGELVNLSKPRHGQSISIDLYKNDPLFAGIPEKITGGLYHSWSVNHKNLPSDLKVIATSGERIMGLRHVEYDIVGLQFHPESYATPNGGKIIKNWLLDEQVKLNS